MTALIAEIGLNHLGEEARALTLLKSVLDSGVDSVTFQIREPKFYESSDATHRPLSPDFYREAVNLAHVAGLHFGVAIADHQRVAEFNEMGVDFWKTLSWDFGNPLLREALFKTNRLIFLSTGVSDMETVVEGSRGLQNSVLIHTQLSQNPEDVNLKAIRAMAGSTGLPVAFGLHCEDHDVLKMALAFEPHSLFFYVKETDVQGLFDDKHALSIDGLKDAIKQLKRLMQALGTGKKVSMQKPAWVVE